MEKSAKLSVVGAILFAIILVIINSGQEEIVFTGVTKDGAERSLDYIKDATIWLAGMQTAMLTALAFLTQDNRKIHAISGPATVVFVGAALFCAAWLITGLPSVAMRVELSRDIIDVLSAPIYSWLPNVINFEYFLTLMHWFWAAGILFFAHTLLVAFSQKRHKTIE
ncbi:hypothetical protein L1286_21305 [Pseudoalteromonas sp. SMS1]|uniref:hypothetical protein n=1 Tax=Pseudoalteromonas sp. SMS1 TaxID=2908894 RepID=UPI001F2A43A5|nr:hypothetical protein [Pseudoalteromonas sp. SMS1]MCF2860024.1 hypothetical protein [Pseudoalteromonas sp. SMS1]